MDQLDKGGWEKLIDQNAFNFAQKRSNGIYGLTTYNKEKYQYYHQLH